MKLSISCVFLITAFTCVLFARPKQTFSKSFKEDRVHEDTTKDFSNYPDIGYSWDSLYKNESQETLDSITRWIDLVHPIATELTIKNVIDISGKYFFRHSFDELTNHLLISVTENLPKVEKPIQADSLRIRTLNELNIKGLYSRDIGEQIWEEDCYIDIPITWNFKNCRLSLDTNHPLVDSINALEISKDEMGYYIPVNTFYTTLDSIKIQTDINLKLNLLFLLYLKVNTLSVAYLLPIDEKYYTIIKNIVQVTESYNLPHENKASQYVFCAKLLASVDPNFYQYDIYTILQTAEAEVSIEEKDSAFLKKIKSIQISFLNSMPWLDLKSYAWRIQIEQFNATKEIASRAELLGNLLQIIEDYMAWCNQSYHEYDKLKEEKMDFMRIAMYISTAKNILQVLKNEDDKNFRHYEVRLIYCLSYFYKIKSQYDKSVNIELALLERVLSTNDTALKIKWLPNLVYSISDSYLNLRNASDFRGWDTLLYKSSPKYRSADIQVFKPSDLRLWNEEDLLEAKEYVDNLNVDSVFKYYSNTTYSINTIMQGRRLALRISLMEANNHKWKSAYQFSRKVDSLTLTNNLNYYISLVDSGSNKFFNVKRSVLKDSLDLLLHEKYRLMADTGWLSFEKDNLLLENSDLIEQSFIMIDSLKSLTDSITILDSLRKIFTDELISIKNEVAKNEKMNRELKDSNVVLLTGNNDLKNKNFILINNIDTLTIVVILLGFAIISAGLAIYSAIKQRRKAIILANYNNYKAKVWQEMGHIPGTSIDDLCTRLKEKGLSNEELQPLVRLKSIIGGLFSSLVTGDDKIGNPLEDEVQLTKLYIDYKNDTTNSTVKFTHDNTGDIKVPPALLLSCMRNAIEHGKLLDEKDAQIHLNIEDHSIYNQLTVYNNGTLFKEEYLNKENIKNSSTGFRNMNDVLTYFNFSKRIKNPVDWNNIDHKIYKVQTLLKVKK